jgi:hypothetical protein
MPRLWQESDSKLILTMNANKKSSMTCIILLYYVECHGGPSVSILITDPLTKYIDAYSVANIKKVHL